MVGKVRCGLARSWPEGGISVLISLHFQLLEGKTQGHGDIPLKVLNVEKDAELGFRCLCCLIA